MKSLPFTVFCLSILIRIALGLSPTYSACQFQKASGESALTGCPEGTLYVSATDQEAHFSTVQDAIDSLPAAGDAFILIGEGHYFEMINVMRVAPLTLLGQLDPATASIPAGNASQRNLVHIWNNRYAGGEVTDLQTAVLTVGVPAGESFGSTDFRAYNINFENLAADYAISQALTTGIVYSNASFYGCVFESWQDTFYAGYESNVFVVDSIIYGEVDYAFGFGRAWFHSSTFANRGCGGGITAWMGEPGTTNGVYVAYSHIIRSPDASPTAYTTGNCFLGRPWNPYAVAVFLQNYMDESIAPAGFTSWDGKSTVPSTTYYAEYGSYGPGGDTSYRVSQDHILDADGAEKYTLDYVFQGSPDWIDYTYQY